VLALSIVSSGFSHLFSSRALAAKIDPEIGIPWDRFCANHKYTALSNCLFCASFIVFRLVDKSMLSIFVVYFFSFDSFHFISDIVDLPMSYSLANDVILLDFTFIQICSLSSIDKTVRFRSLGFLAILTLQLDSAILLTDNHVMGVRWSG